MNFTLHRILMDKLSQKAPEYVLALHTLVNEHPVSIEVLPGGLKEWSNIAPGDGSYYPFLFIEGNLGIPKKVLYILYVTAIGMSRHADDAETLEACTTVILIANPAHNTALNHRKKLMERGSLSSDKELLFMELLIRGSGDCAKQSIIWHHRQWVFKRLCGDIGGSTKERQTKIDGWASVEEAPSFPKLLPHAIEHEFEIIRHAVESYPRNYHAWAHWHYIMDASYTLACLYDGYSRQYIDSIVKEGSQLRLWIDTHVSDYSAIHQFCSLIRLLNKLSLGVALDYDKLPALDPSSMAEHAYSLVTLYPSHESLWMYLRVALSLVPRGEQDAFLERITCLPASSSIYSLHFLKRYSSNEK